jgi:hypothetical protein
MGTKSREKWLRRLEAARMSNPTDVKAAEMRKWHASWLIPIAASVVTTWIAAGSVIEMFYLFAVIWIGFAISMLVIWLLTNPADRRLMKFALTMFFFTFSIAASTWAYKNDRPIIDPTIGGVVTQNFDGKWLALDLEANIQNSGRQPSYAKSWDLELDINGKKFHARQRFGEELPKGTLKLAELRDQEFPVGKPVSGWLFFAFPDLLHTGFEPYSTCGSLLARDVTMTLTVTDSKMGRAFSQTRNLEDLLKEGCSPIVPASAPL